MKSLILFAAAATALSAAPVAPANPTYAERRAQAECVEAAIEAGEAQLQQKLADAGLRRFAENRTIRVAAAR